MKNVFGITWGPFENEEYRLNRIEKYVEAQGLINNGYHHEKYLVKFVKEKDWKPISN